MDMISDNQDEPENRPAAQEGWSEHSAPKLTKEQQVGQIQSIVRARHQEWSPADERTREALHRMIGCIREQAALLDGDIELKGVLAIQLNLNKELPLPWRKVMHAKPAAELLLVMLLGLDKKTAAKKSQYLAAIRAADHKGIASTEEATAAWLTKEGGVIGVRKHLPKKQRESSKESIAVLAERLAEQTAERPVYKVKVPDNVVYHDGYALLLIKQPEPDDASGEAVVSSPIDSQDIILAAAKHVTEVNDLKAGVVKARKLIGGRSRAQMSSSLKWPQPKGMWGLADKHDRYSGGTDLTQLT